MVWRGVTHPIPARAVLDLDSGNANAYFNRGSTHDSLGAYDRAIADYTKALELDKAVGTGGAGADRDPVGGSGIAFAAAAAVSAARTRQQQQQRAAQAFS